MNLFTKKAHGHGSDEKKSVREPKGGTFLVSDGNTGGTWEAAGGKA